MASVKKRIFSNKRQGAYFLFIALLVSIFIIGFYFYYVPANKRSLHRYAFSILENISANMQQRYNDHYKLIKGRVENAAGDNTKLQKIPDKYNTIANQAPEQTRQAFVFQVDQSLRELSIALPSEELLKPLLQGHRDEIFESFLLVGIRDEHTEPLYVDPDLYIASNFATDSLFSGRHHAIFSGIRALHIRDLEYKMFFVPFSLNGEKLVLCGFVKSHTYSAAAYQLPVEFIYTLVILLLLVLISLPLIRLYTIGTHETIRFRDLLAVVASLFAGCTIITLIIIHVALLINGDIVARRNIKTLSEQVNTGLVTEIQKAYRQLDSIDNYVNRNLQQLQAADLTKINATPLLLQYLECHKKDSTLYYQFDRIAWVNTRGKQFMKAEPQNEDPVFQDVYERNYFTAFTNGRSYAVPGNENSAMALEAVYNWINGEFRIILSKRSKVDSALIVNMSMQMYTLTNTVLPAGYGFCIMDRSGRVQAHSTEHRSLNENLFNQTTAFRQLEGAVISRQETHFDNMDLYGKNHAVHIVPTPGMPFFLVTFYDKGYIIPVNMRILIFSLVFCGLGYFLIGLFWLAVFWKRYYTKPLLTAPVQIFSRVVPKQQNSAVYRKGAIFVGLYMACLGLLPFASRFADLQNNYLTLVIVLLTPLNIVSGLIMLIYGPVAKKGTQPAERAIAKRRVNWAMRLLIGISLLTVIITSGSSYVISPQLMFFQGLLVALLAIYYYKAAPPTAQFTVRDPLQYLRHYAAFWTVLILCLAALPAALFTWYPHNQEILQSVKKQQLHFAHALDERKDAIRQFISLHDTSWLPEDLTETLLYGKGLYTIYDDAIALSSQKTTDAPYAKSYEEFYFDVASSISNTYYDPYSYPPLRDSSSDGRWTWSAAGKKQLLFSCTLPPDATPEKNASAKYLAIQSQLPPRFLFLQANFRGLALLLVSVLLMAGLYVLIRRLAERIFLRKFFLAASPDSTAGLHKLVNNFHAVSLVNEKLVEELYQLHKEHEHTIPVSKKEMYQYEQELIASMSKFRSFFDFVWKGCTNRQQYLLYNFARYGLMNGRNSVDIYALMKKGILFMDKGKEEIVLVSRSFRAYVLSALPDEQVIRLKEEWKTSSAWGSFRVPFLLILLSVAAFVFFTQQDVWQRIIALITGFGSTLPLLMNILKSAGSSNRSA